MGSKKLLSLNCPRRSKVTPWSRCNHHEDENRLPDGFEDYYREQFGPRWPQLLSSLLEPSTRVDRLNAFFESIPTHPPTPWMRHGQRCQGLSCFSRGPRLARSSRRAGSFGRLTVRIRHPWIAASALEVQPGSRSGHVCAAPGGKSPFACRSHGRCRELVANELSLTRRAKLKTILEDYLPGNNASTSR